VPPVKTWLIRHGESQSNAGMPALGNAEVTLTSLGEYQSLMVAERITSMPDRLIVSPFLRARIMANAIERRWPGARSEVWPIQELTYLSPKRCLGTTTSTRQSLVKDYWQRCDPDYRDGEDAESFREFVERLLEFHRRLQALDVPFAVVVGHGQFFAAYLFARANGFTLNRQWMQSYRATETSNPIRNGEIVEVVESSFGEVARSRTGG